MTAKTRAAGDDKSNPFSQSDASICDNQLIACAMRSIPCVMNESLQSDETDVDRTIVPSSLQCSQDSIRDLRLVQGRGVKRDNVLLLGSGVE